jgi:phosphopantothenoylcysteine decarboxylase/phosphopantothenate--cysteine ligase
MLDAALAIADVDIALLAAAVADYRPAEALAGKRPKDDRGWTVELEPTSTSRARSASGSAAGQILVAFGADHGRGGARAQARRCSRRSTPTSSSSTTSAAGHRVRRHENEVVLVTGAGERTVPKASKQQIAAAILDAVEELLGARASATV